MQKSAEWIVLVLVVCLYLVMRSKHLSWFERVASALVSAGMAYAGSEHVAAWMGGNELLAAIAIMVIGPMVLGAVMSVAEDEDFLRATLQDWARSRLGLERKSDVAEKTDESRD